MPEMSGYEVCERLKADGPLSGIAVVFLSALCEAEDRVKGFRVGAVDYIPKPFEIEEVQARVETHLKLRRAQQVERELLERTLGGAVTTLWELVQLTSPVLALRSRAIREIVCWIATRVPTTLPSRFGLNGIYRQWPRCKRKSTTGATQTASLRGGRTQRPGIHTQRPPTQSQYPLTHT